MKILITGICGFVGSEIALQLRENLSVADLQIIGIDNLSRNGSWRNRERLDTQEIAVVHGDIRLATDLDAVGAVDWVIDAAANPSVLAGVDGKSSSRQLIELARDTLKEQLNDDPSVHIPFHNFIPGYFMKQILQLLVVLLQ